MGGPRSDPSVVLCAQGIAEWAPFAATLAGRLAHLLARGQLAVGGPLWQLALEQLLLRCVDTETQVVPAPPLTVLAFFMF